MPFLSVNSILIGSLVVTTLLHRNTAMILTACVAFYGIYLSFKLKKPFFEQQDRTLHWLWIWFVGVIFLSYAANGLFGLDQFSEWSQHRWIIFFYALVFIFRHEKLGLKPTQVFLALVSLSLLSSLGYFFWTHRGQLSETLRFKSFLENPNEFAPVVMVLTFITGGLALAHPKLKIWGSAAFALSFLACVLTYTRSAWAGVGVGMSLAIVGYFGVKNFKSYLLIGALGFGALLVNFKGIISRISVTATDHVATLDRVLLWEVNLRIFKENPIFGVGYYENVYRLQDFYIKYGIPLDSFKAQPHNQYINYLAGTGIVGLTAYLLLWGFFIFRNIQWIKKDSKDSLAWAALGAQVAFCIGCIGDCMFEAYLAKYMLLIVWAVVLVQSSPERKDTKFIYD